MINKVGGLLFAPENKFALCMFVLSKLGLWAASCGVGAKRKFKLLIQCLAQIGRLKGSREGESSVSQCHHDALGK